MQASIVELLNTLQYTHSTLSSFWITFFRMLITRACYARREIGASVRASVSTATTLENKTKKETRALSLNYSSEYGTEG